MGDSSEVRFFGRQMSPLLAVIAFDAVALGIVMGLTVVSGGFDGGVVAGGLSIILFFAIMAWFFIALRGTGYRSPHRLYDAEFHAIQVDQQIMQAGEIRPRTSPRGLHLTMLGIVVSLGVLMFVFASV